MDLEVTGWVNTREYQIFTLFERYVVTGLSFLNQSFSIFWDIIDGCASIPNANRTVDGSSGVVTVQTYSLFNNALIRTETVTVTPRFTAFGNQPLGSAAQDALIGGQNLVFTSPTSNPRTQDNAFIGGVRQYTEGFFSSPGDVAAAEWYMCRDFYNNLPTGRGTFQKQKVYDYRENADSGSVVTRTVTELFRITVS
jgi:hypothetical protein